MSDDPRKDDPRWLMLAPRLIGLSLAEADALLAAEGVPAGVRPAVLARRDLLDRSTSLSAAHSRHQAEPPTAGRGCRPTRIVPRSDFHTAGGFEVLGPLAADPEGVWHSSVYLARGEFVQVDLAVKLLDRGAAPDKLRQAAAINQALFLKQISHPNVVTVYSAGESDHGPYVAMEYVDGGTLGAWVRRHSLWLRGHPREARRLAAAVVRTLARALAEVHEVGIVHGDLKPDNVMVAGGDLSESATAALKLIDFGSAVSVEPAADRPDRSVRLTGGTPPFVAPELYAATAATPEADVFALGVLLVYVAAGGVWPAEVTERLPELRELADSPPGRGGAAESSVVPDFGLLADRTLGDPTLAAVARWCVADEPVRRYRRAADLAEDLGRWLDDRPVEGPGAAEPYPYTVAERVRLFVRRAGRTEEEFRTDRQELWGLYLLGVVSLLNLLTMALGVGLIYAGLDPVGVNAAMDVIWIGGSVGGAVAAWRVTREKQLLVQSASLLGMGCGVGLLLQLVILPDILLLTPVLFVVAGLTASLASFLSDDWKPTRWVGAVMLLLAPAVWWLCREHPRLLAPWGGFLVGSGYLVMFARLGFRYAKPERVKEVVRAVFSPRGRSHRVR